MKILGLDLGTNTGYVAGDTDSSEITMGTWKLATTKEIRGWGLQRLTRRCDPRPKRLCNFINSRILSNWVPDLIVFEDVQFASSTYQTQLWASLRTGVWMCFGDVVKFDCVPVATLKKFATGNGAATKEQMKHIFIHHETDRPAGLFDDNAIDAYFVWKWAKQNLSRTKAKI